MGGIIVVVLIVYVLIYVKKENQKKRLDSAQRMTDRKPAGKMAAGNGTKKKGKLKTSAVPNRPRVCRKTQKQEPPRQGEDRKRCTYEAAYSKGRPSRLGMRGDCESAIPSGMERAVCPYCGAENFVPAGNREHYHCFFCWEKL